MMSSGESATSRRRVETSRKVPLSTASTPSSAQALKALVPGLMTSSAPAKPMTTAVQRRQPDVLAEKQRGRRCQAERRHLQDAHQVGERHARQRSLEEQGAAHVADAPPAHGAHERVPEPVDRPGPEGRDGDDRDGADAADEDGLARGERARHELHGRVAAGEERGRRHHRGDALEVAGADVTGLARRERVCGLPAPVSHVSPIAAPAARCPCSVSASHHPDARRKWQGGLPRASLLAAAASRFCASCRLIAPAPRR